MKREANINLKRPKWCHKFNDVLEDDNLFYIQVNGKEVIIDKEDIEKIFPYKVCITQDGYAVTKHRYVHRLIMNCPNNMDIDHINHNPLDNRKCNLRIVSRTINNLNRKAATNTGEYGITLRKDGWYMVTINKYCGIKKTLEEAITLRDECLKGTKLAEYNYYLKERNSANEKR